MEPRQNGPSLTESGTDALLAEQATLARPALLCSRPPLGKCPSQSLQAPPLASGSTRCCD